jgi:hypothetical protein
LDGQAELIRKGVIISIFVPVISNAATGNSLCSKSTPLNQNECSEYGGMEEWECLRFSTLIVPFIGSPYVSDHSAEEQ